MGKDNAYPPDEFTDGLFTSANVQSRGAAAFTAGILFNKLESDLLTGFGLPGEIHGPGWLWCRSYFLGAVPDPLAKAAMKRAIDRGYLIQEPIYDELRGFTGSGFRPDCADGRRVALIAAVRRGWVKPGPDIQQEDIDAAQRTGDWRRTQPLMDTVKGKEVRREVEAACTQLLRLVQEILLFTPSRPCGHMHCRSGWTAAELAEFLDIADADFRRGYASALLKSLKGWGMAECMRMVNCPGRPLPLHARCNGAPRWAVEPRWRHFVHYAAPEAAWRRRPPEAA